MLQTKYTSLDFWRKVFGKIQGQMVLFVGVCLQAPDNGGGGSDGGGAWNCPRNFIHYESSRNISHRPGSPGAATSQMPTPKQMIGGKLLRVATKQNGCLVN